MNNQEIWEINEVAIELMKEQAVMTANKVSKIFDDGEGGDK